MEQVGIIGANETSGWIINEAIERIKGMAGRNRIESKRTIRRIARKEEEKHAEIH